MAHPQVEYRRLGKSGLRVSVPILGAMSFGSEKWMPWVLNEDKALPILKAAWDLGVNTWDTANVYSNGESERIIAKAIKKYNIPRSKLVILTKCHGLVHEDPGVRTVVQQPNLKNTRDYLNMSGLSRQAIFQQVEASLKRLDTEYIDLLQIHRVDMNTPFEETMCALNDLVRSGKVRYIGASSMWAWQFAEYQKVAEKNGWAKFVSMQNRYSLMYREEEREMNKYCDFAGIGLIPYFPLEGGELARPLSETSLRAEFFKKSDYQTEKTDVDKEIINRVEKIAKPRYLMQKTDADKEIINRVEKIAKVKGWKMSQVAQAWIKTKVSSPIIGFSSATRVEEAIIPDKKLTEEEIKYLEEPYVPKPILGHN
ncbi:Aldo/keto reductase [Calocera viscosa TUFC12733]|uniref:Aldo/keto reductase n=1 Tax=Calocera viscosa (strain TUFC12733) TaxID=1330018 RepID=A0A167MRB2_CALVF|nr:Aldo/keto reductase [Calocera viscosa TUFC12733]